MVDGTIQLPGDSTGKILDTSDISFGVGSTSRHRERVVLGDATSTTGLATVTSSAGLLATISSGTVTSTAATNPWSSAPGFNVPVVTVSSGLVQISGTATVLSASSGLIQVNAFLVSPTSSVAGAGMAVVTSSFGVAVQSTQPVTVTSGLISVTSGTVTLSSVHTVLTASSGFVQALFPIMSSAGFGPVTSSFGILSQVSSGSLISLTSGLISVTSGTITATAGTNPWSSAPGFNVPVVNASSGAVQISGTATVLSASSGLVQISGIPTVIVASSAGYTQTISVGVTTSGLVPSFQVTTGGGALTQTSSQGLMVQQSTSKIVPVLSASSGVVSIDLWQGTSRIAPTFVIATTISAINVNSGNLFLLTGFTTSTGGIGATTPALIRLYNATTSNVTMNTGVQCIVPLGMQSSSTAPGGDSANPLMLANFLQIGMGFATACSFDLVQTATSTAAVAGTGYITALYSTV